MLIGRFRTAFRGSIALRAGVAAICMLGSGQAAMAETGRLALMPLPQSVERQDGTLRLDGALAPTIAGCSADIVPGAVARFGQDVAKLTGATPSDARIPLTVTCAGHDGNGMSLQTREGYRLTVTASGIQVDADGETAVLRALATLRQLVDRDAQGAFMPAVRIGDAPRFAWRGLMIDTARHFVAASTIKRQIDAMEQAKLNVLHLHLADNEGFRIESRVWPRLTTIASHGQYYTQAEIRDLVRYATERGVRIIPEIDLPGHSGALLSAYPELAVAPIDPKDPLAKPKSALNPASEKTYHFLEKLLAEITPLFPDSQFHVGGDEVSDVAWKDNAEIAAFKAKHGLTTKTDVEAFFHARLRAILASHGKSTIGWDEMADGPLPKDVIVQAWRSSNPVSTATATGHRVIVSAGFYINDLRSADWYYAINLLDPMAYSTMTAEVLANVRRNPVSAAQVSDGLVGKAVPPLTADQEKLVIGGEAPLWAETVTDEMVDGRLWPRGLALGERFWSSASVQDADDMYARLLPTMDRLRALGLLDEPLRQRMIARLAPDEPEVVGRLVGLVGPTHLFANHMDAMMSGKVPELVELTDAASTDGSPARRFRVNVAAYLAGDKARSAVLRSELKMWQDNQAAFTKVAAGRPLLQKAVPTADDIAALGQLGLAALDALDQGKAIDPRDLTQGRALFAKLKKYEDGSKDLGSITPMNQPPAALLILTAPDVERLVDAAAGARNAR